jgi:hypothetical protein
MDLGMLPQKPFWCLVMFLAAPPLSWAGNPADPSAAVPPARYAPVIGGAKSYRPVDPLPWGDLNRRVAPPAERPPEGAAPSQGKGTEPTPLSPQHKH